MWYCNCGYTFRGIVEIYSQLISFDSPQLLKLGIYFMLLSLVSTRTRYQTRSDQICNADCRPFPLILNKYGSMFLNIIFTKNDRRITSSISLSNTQSQHPKSCKWVLIIVEVIENRNIWFRHFPPSFNLAILARNTHKSQSQGGEDWTVHEHFSFSYQKMLIGTNAIDLPRDINLYLGISPGK